MVERKEAAVRKRRGGVRAYEAIYATAAVNKGVSSRGGYLVLSVQVRGLSEDQKDRRVDTLGPSEFIFSP